MVHMRKQMKEAMEAVKRAGLEDATVLDIFEPGARNTEPGTFQLNWKLKLCVGLILAITMVQFCAFMRHCRSYTQMRQTMHSKQFTLAQTLNLMITTMTVTMLVMMFDKMSPVQLGSIDVLLYLAVPFLLCLTEFFVEVRG